MKKRLKLYGHEALVQRVIEAGKSVRAADDEGKFVILEAEDYVAAAAKENPEICPRCGNGMDERPALSRRVSVSICSECGTEEAMADLRGDLDTIDKWIVWKEV